MRSALLVVVVVLAAGCAGGGKAAPSTPDPALGMTPKERFAAAEPDVAKYLQALAMKKPLVAQELAGSDAPGYDEPSLSALRAWFERLPIGQLRVTSTLYKVKHRSRGINYGANRVRFTGMVPAGGRIRLRLSVKAVEAMKDGGTRITNEGTMELEGRDRPVLVAETIGVSYD